MICGILKTDLLLPGMEGEEDWDSTTVFYYTTVIVLPGRGKGTCKGGGKKKLLMREKRKSHLSETSHFITQGHCLVSVSHKSKREESERLLINIYTLAIYENFV